MLKLFNLLDLFFIGYLIDIFHRKANNIISNLSNFGPESVLESLYDT